MAGVYKGLTIKIGADTTGLSKALNGIDSQTRGLKRNMSQINKALKLDPGNTELVRQKMQAYQREIQTTSKRLEVLKKAEAEIGKGGMSTEQWDTLQREIASTEGKLKQLTTEYRNFVAAQSGLGKAGAAVTELGNKLNSISPMLNSVGNALTVGLTVPIVGAAGASVKAAVDIDSALTGVKKTVNGTAEEFEDLKESAIEFSKVNAISAVDVLHAEELGGQLGVAKENLKDFAEVTTGLSVSTNMNVEAASTNMARFMNITQMNADATKNATEQYHAYGNVVVGLGNNLATTESEISDFSLRMASAGALAGMSQADILGLGGAMSSLGLEAEMGGTAFSRTIQEISIAASTGSDELEGFAHVAGYSAEDFAAKWKNDATGAFIDFVNGLAAGREAGEDMNVVLEALGITGLRQSDAIRRLAGNTTLLADAVKLANDEWRDGSALSNEVANRNSSLASQFEMLKNRVTAVAEEVGVPLANAMLDLVDAAEPLFQAIEDGARAFSDMDVEEQRVVINTVALIAALGPGLKAFSKVTGSVQVLGGALTKLSQFLTNTTARHAELAVSIDKVRAAQARHVASLGTESAALKAYENRLLAAQKAEEKSAAASKAASVAMGLAKAAAISLAVAGVAVLVSEIQKYVETQQNFAQATSGLVDAAGMLGDGASKAGGAIDRANAAFGVGAGAVRNYRDEVNKLAEEQAQLASNMGESFSGVNESNGALQIYASKIVELAGNCGNSAEKVAELKVALEGYNSIAGTSYQVTDETTGAINASTDALQANANAWKANAEAEALQSAMTDVYKERIRLEGELEDAQEASRDSQKAYNQALKDGDMVMADFYGRQLAEADGAVEKTTKLLDANYAAEKKLTDQKVETDRAHRIATSTLENYVNALGEEEDGLGQLESVMSTLGKESAQDVVDAFKVAEISAEDFAKVGVKSFDLLYQQSGQDMAKVKTAIDMLNAAGIDPKSIEVQDGELVDAEGHIIDIDNMTIDDKEVNVYVRDHDTESKLERIRQKISEIPTDKEVNIRATSIISNFVSGLFGGAASGGIVPEPLRRLPRHADGGISGIATGPTLTNIGWVGEAGAEAIIPLTNRRYVRPFAQAVASEMGGSSQQVVNNYYSINGMEYLPGSAIAEHVEAIFLDVEQGERMR